MDQTRTTVECRLHREATTLVVVFLSNQMAMAIRVRGLLEFEKYQNHPPEPCVSRDWRAVGLVVVYVFLSFAFVPAGKNSHSHRHFS